MLRQLYRRLLPIQLQVTRPARGEGHTKRSLRKVWFATGAILLGLVLSLGLAQAAAPTVILTIPLNSSLTGVAVNPVTNRVYVAGRNPNLLYVIDGMNNSLITTIGIGSGADTVDVNPVTNRIYVATAGSNAVNVIDGVTNTAIASISTPSTPVSVRVNPTTNRIYVPYPGSNSVGVIDGATNTLVGNIPVGSSPENVTVNPTTNRIYVANFSSNNVSVIDSAIDTVVATIGVGVNPSGIEVNPATNRIYVSNLVSNSVSVIDGLTNAVIATTGVGSFPNGVDVNPSTNFIYVANGSGSVSIIDGVTNTVAYTVGVGSSPNYVAVNPNTNLVYVPNGISKNVSVIGEVLPPLLSKSFSPATIAPGGVSTLTFTLTNPSSTYPLGGVGFTDNLPSQLTVAPAPNSTNTCGSGNLTASPGSSTINLSGIDLAPSQSCTISVDITSNIPGSWTNTLSAVNYFGTTSSVSATATLNVTSPTLAIGDVTQNEGNAGPTAFNFPVTLSAPVGITVTVTYNTSDGTATAPSDYTATSGTVTFAPGVVTQTVTVQVNGDTTYEPDEDFSVNLSSPTGASIEDGSATGTIQNDDAPPSLSISNVSQIEGNSGTTNFVFTVSLSQASGFTTTVNYASTNDTATAPSDYAAVSGTLTFAPGVISQTVTVLVNGDTIFEPDEAFTFILSVPTNATIATAQGTGTINNDDGVPALSTNDVSQNEGNSGTTNFTFTVSLAGSTALTTTVNYSSANGTAIAPSDYTATSGTLTFVPGVVTQTVTVSVNGDTTYEPDETFFVNLTAPTNATIGDGQALGTIVNDEAAPPSISISGVSQDEGNSGTTAFNFTVTLAEASGVTATVNYTTLDDTATAGSDYTAASGTITFEPGVTSQGVTVQVNGDTTYEPDETFSVKLTSPTNTTIQEGAGEGTGTITNDDAVPALSINDASQNESNSGSTIFTFTVSLSSPSGVTTTVNFATANGTATAADDYTATSGTLNFAPGVITQSVLVLVNGDTVYEPDETFFVNLTTPSGATIADSQGTGSIKNDDGVPTISINDVSKAEGNTGTTAFDFTVSLNAASNVTATVNYATADGTAQIGSDYIAASGTLTFSPGVLTQTISMLVNGDTTYEPDETFLVNLSSPTSATIEDTQGLATIQNDEATPPGVTINDVSMSEGNSGSTPFVFTVTLAQASGLTAKVNYATVNATATTPDDYTATSGTLTFAPGVVTQTITVLVNCDTLAEDTENFSVKLSNPINTSIGNGGGQGTGTILNDDAVPPISINNVSKEEGNSGTTTFVFTVTLEEPSGVATNLIYSTQDGTATVADNDYQPIIAGTATIAAGQTSTTITVLVNGDIKVEDDETFSLKVQMTAPLPSSAQTSALEASGTGSILNDDARKNMYQPPADLIGQLRQNPDRVAASDAGNEIRYTFTVKNVGQGKASSVSLTLPVNPQLVLGYTQFVNPNVWVTDVTTTEVTINLPGIEYNRVVTGTLVFRPSSVVTPSAGSIVSSRYSLLWTNPASGNGQTLSNAVSFSFGEAGLASNQDVSGGQIQLMTADAPADTKVTYHSNFWIPNETVTSWLTTPDGKSTALISGSADSQGNFSITVDSSGLGAGTYVVAAYGARSEVYGSGLLVVGSTGNTASGQATNLKLNSLGAKALEIAPTKP